MSQNKVAKAIKLVDRMANLSDGERQLLRQRIPEAVNGNDWALGYVMRFLYDGKVNREITSQILDLIRG